MAKCLYPTMEQLGRNRRKYICRKTMDVFDTHHWNFSYSCCSFRFWTRKFNESRLFCLRKLIQAHLSDPFQSIIIVGFCNVILFTPGRYIHTFRTVLTFSDLFCPVHKSDLLCNQAGLFCHREYLHK